MRKILPSNFMEFMDRKHTYLFLSLFLAIAPGLTSCSTTGQPLLSKKEPELTVRTTAYSHNEKDHIIYKKKNAVGTNLKYTSKLRSAAADWSEYPVGTEFRIASEPGVTYVIDDYGSALVGTKTIDLYKPSIRSMNQWGVRHVDIEVLKWGCYEESLKIMNPRTRYKHVRAMVQSIIEEKKAKISDPDDKA